MAAVLFEKKIIRRLCLGMSACVLLAGCSRMPLALGKDSCRRTEVSAPGLLPQRVQWIHAAPKPERHSLDLWCETVGPAVLLPQPSVRDSAQPVADSIAIVTWNVHVGGGDVERLVRDLRSGRFTDGDTVAHFVLLLQEAYRASDSVPATVRIEVPSRISEVPPNGKRRDVVANAYETGLSLLYVPSMRNGANAREDRGNAVLSSLELKDPKAADLPFERQRRTAALATVEGTTSSGRAWKLTVASIHLDNWSRPTRLPASVGLGRLRQVRALATELEDEENIVVAGDFNTWAAPIFERSIAWMRDEFEDTPAFPEQITYVHGRTRRRLDYMFFRLPDGWSARYERLSSRFGSDHYPQLGWIVFERH
jgi:endonuclease/exonuclease/phosphatase family metal-dependent hydrolase